MVNPKEVQASIEAFDQALDQVGEALERLGATVAARPDLIGEVVLAEVRLDALTIDLRRSFNDELPVPLVLGYTPSGASKG